jgi:hypothetical protein
MIWPPLKELFIVEVAYPLTVLSSVGVWWLAEHLPAAARHVVGRVRRDDRRRPAALATDHPPLAVSST